MLKSYAAFYHNGQLEWIDDQPEENHFKMIITIVDNFPLQKRNTELQNTLNKAWGAFGQSKSLDELDKELHQLRVENWES